jgi:hypothetical protein
MSTDETTGSKNIKVEILSQKDFDAMSDAKKIFYLELIKKGQVKISNGIENPKPEKPRKHEEGRSPFSWLKNKTVRVTLVTGEMLTGLLTDVWQYEIALDIPGSNPVLIMKHSLMIVQEVLP